MQQNYTQEQMLWLQQNNPAELQRHINEWQAEQAAAQMQAQFTQAAPVQQQMQPVQQTLQTAPTQSITALLQIADEAAEIENHAEIRTGSLARAGLAWLRLLSYVEIGVHPKKNPTHSPSMVAVIEFELHHPDHIDDYQGVRKPRKLSVRVPKTHGQNSGFPKFFKALRRAMGDRHDHISQMIGEACLGNIYHNKDTAGNTWENLDADGAWSFAPITGVNPADGSTYVVNVPPLFGQPSLFIMENEKNLANPAHMKAMWDSIYVDGTRTVKGKDGAPDKEVSNNYYQEQIMKSLNWEQSRAKAVLDSVGCTTMTPEVRALLNQKAQVPQQQLVGAMNGLPALPAMAAAPQIQQLQPALAMPQQAIPQQALPDTMQIQPMQMLTQASLPAQTLQTAMPQALPVQQTMPQIMPQGIPQLMPQQAFAPTAQPQAQTMPGMTMAAADFMAQFQR